MKEDLEKNYEVEGFESAAVAAGLKQTSAPDMALFYSYVPAVCAGAFTSNNVPAAPVILTRESIKNNLAQAILVNAGNANACTGVKGMADAGRMADETAAALKIDSSLALVASTGIIGHNLPMNKVSRGIKRLQGGLGQHNFYLAAKAIMTTDTFPKLEQRVFTLGGKEVRMLGIAKGAGMIEPHMATLLAFVFTDAAIEAAALKKVFKHAVGESFNKISVDGDTSTNDMAIIMANGMAGNRSIGSRSRMLPKFRSELESVLMGLAMKIVKDGEGATKFIRIEIQGARTKNEALKVARRIANSPLVKTAFFGEDPNWGRIMGAIGASGIKINPEKIDIHFDDLMLVKRGRVADGNPEVRAAKILKQKDILLTVNLNRGNAGTHFYTCDLSYDYVKINADYST